MGCKTVVRQQGQPLKRRSGEWEDLASLDKLVLRRDAWGPHTDSRLPQWQEEMRCSEATRTGHRPRQIKRAACAEAYWWSGLPCSWWSPHVPAPGTLLLILLGKKRLNIQALTLGWIYVLLGMQLHPQSAAYNYKSGWAGDPHPASECGSRPRDYTLVVRSLS
jgi:hypothetical protein